MQYATPDAVLRHTYGFSREDGAKEIEKPALPPSDSSSDQTVPELLRAGADTYEQRNALYGDNYKHFGPVMAGMFPDGLQIDAPDDWVRLGLLVQAVAKLTRYAANFSRGGHRDSAHDLCVYAAMLEEMTK